MTEFKWDAFKERCKWFDKQHEELNFQRRLFEMDENPTTHWMSLEEQCKLLRDNPDTPVWALGWNWGTKPRLK